MKSIALLTLSLLSLIASTADARECVVLLHGLARTANSMDKLASRLEIEGFAVVNIDYESRNDRVEPLADAAVEKGIKTCQKRKAEPINFVTHSLGGILVRQYYSKNSPSTLKRVVMLGPPNRGSEVVDNLKGVPGYELINGPAGMQLGTDSKSLPLQLGPVNFELGIIAGTQSINLILSSFLPNPDDGKVSVANTKVAGMCSFVALSTSHPFMMKNDTVIQEVLNFLQTGKFDSENASNGLCQYSQI